MPIEFDGGEKKFFARQSRVLSIMKFLAQQTHQLGFTLDTPLTDTLFVVRWIDLEPWMARALERTGQIVADLLALVARIALVDICGEIDRLKWVGGVRMKKKTN
jgi:hypothetical protein